MVNQRADDNDINRETQLFDGAILIQMILLASERDAPGYDSQVT